MMEKTAKMTSLPYEVQSIGSTGHYLDFNDQFAVNLIMRCIVRRPDLPGDVPSGWFLADAEGYQ